MKRILPVVLILLCIVSAGCSSPAQTQQPQPQPTTQRLYLYGNGTYNVNGTLQQVNGTLHIASMPPGADIYIDNEYWCPTDCALSYVITPGRHSIELRKSGYETVVYPVTVVKGGMEGVNITLVKEGSRQAGISATATGAS